MKQFLAEAQFGTLKQLAEAAKPYNAKVVRAKKGSRQIIIYYDSIVTLTKIIYNAALNL